MSSFISRHVGITTKNMKKMLKKLKVKSMKQLTDEINPLFNYPLLKLHKSRYEERTQTKLKEMMSKNIDNKPMIGYGFYDTITPYPIKRHILENPKWYTAYTPYQPEISQGRLESQYNYQTLIQEITQMDVSNASLLDQSSAGSEAMLLSYNYNGKNEFLCSDTVYPHIIDSLETKSKNLNIDLIVKDVNGLEEHIMKSPDNVSGVMIQYPDVYGNVNIPEELIDICNQHNIVKVASTDLMANMILKPPGHYGFDICFGNAQRFGVPLWYGGPHPAFFAVKNKYIRHLPGRLIGRAKDSIDNDVYRLALQTREQHIKQDKATSNICTSQSLLANVVGMYGIYHQHDGLSNIANDIHTKTKNLAHILNQIGVDIVHNQFFDTLYIKTPYAEDIMNTLAVKNRIMIVKMSDADELLISLDEKTTIDETLAIFEAFFDIHQEKYKLDKQTYDMMYYNLVIDDEVFQLEADNYLKYELNKKLLRTDKFLNKQPFIGDNDETSLMRYITHLENKDYTLCNGTIPLGSCTMKLNATYQLEPLSWDKTMNFHPYLHDNWVPGYQQLIKETGEQLKEITGFSGISFQSNSGATGEYVGLLCIKKYLNDPERNICLIPETAHGTNFSSAKLAGFKIHKINEKIFTDVEKLKEYIEPIKHKLGCAMITYPGTNGVFQNNIKEIIELIHSNNGLVYMDGANMNAMVGLLKPAELGFDVCHLNLHKTFCIPHGGGGPGMGPVLCNDKLLPYLPTNIYTYNSETDQQSIGSVSSSLNSSASLLTIPFSYIDCIGDDLKKCSEISLLNANYLKNSLEKHYKIVDVNYNGRVGHEFIIDVSEFKKYNITENDIAKRLMDYSFHPPTMSWPRKQVIMFEPTESESLQELDRLINAMINIKKEIMEIENGEYDTKNNVLKNAPHCMEMVSNWSFPYTPEKAFYPVEDLKKNKYWTPVGRIDNVKGDSYLLKQMKS